MAVFGLAAELLAVAVIMLRVRVMLVASAVVRRNKEDVRELLRMVLGLNSIDIVLNYILKLTTIDSTR